MSLDDESLKKPVWRCDKCKGQCTKAVGAYGNMVGTYDNSYHMNSDGTRVVPMATDLDIQSTWYCFQNHINEWGGWIAHELADWFIPALITRVAYEQEMRDCLGVELVNYKDANWDLGYQIGVLTKDCDEKDQEIARLENRYKEQIGIEMRRRDELTLERDRLKRALETTEKSNLELAKLLQEERYKVTKLSKQLDDKHAGLVRMVRSEQTWERSALEHREELKHLEPVLKALDKLNALLERSGDMKDYTGVVNELRMEYEGFLEWKLYG